MDDDQYEPIESRPSPQVAEEAPAGGGSYIRQADGSLLLVAGTEPAGERADTASGATGDADKTE